MRFAASVLLLSSLALLTTSCAGDARSSPDRDHELTVRRGDLPLPLLLTGELEAAENETLRVPAVPQWRVTIRWLIEDGTEVKKGDRVAELDNTPFLGPLKENTLAALTTESELAKQESEAAAEELRRQIELDLRTAELEKARLDASVPEGLRPRMEQLNAEMTQFRSELNLDRSRDELRSHRTGSEAEHQALQIRYDKAAREIEVAERSIAALTLTAPRDGIAIIHAHPWTGRKLIEGDNIWVGRPVVRIPDLQSLRIRARLSDVDDGRVSVGQPVEAVLDSYPDEVFRGTVIEVGDIAREPEGQTLRRFFDVIVELETVDAERMIPGQSVRLTIRQEPHRDALLIPRASLDLTAAVPRVELQGGGRMEVELGACNAQDCILLGPSDALPEGTRLIPAGVES